MKKIMDYLKSTGSGIVVSFAFAFMLCIYAPFELYLTNQSEFWFDAVMMLKPAALLFALVFVGCVTAFLIVRLFGKTPYDVVLALSFAALVYFYIQGNYFIGGLPPLDGTNVDWSAPSPERIKSIVAIIVCLAACGVVFWKFRKKFSNITMLVSGGLALMLMLTMGTMLLTTEIEDKTGRLKCYNEGEFEYSTKENFIILLLDSVDAGTFEEAIKKNPEFADTFDDFTYFDNTLAAYPFSMHAVPHLLSGQWYENDGSFHEYMQSSINSSPLIGALEDADYRMGVYSEYDITLEGELFKGRFENHIELVDTFVSDFRFMVMLVKMAGLKYAPWDMKEFSYNMGQYSLDNRVAATDEGYEHFSWSNEAFYNSVKNTDTITTTTDKTFRFIHLYGAHLPLRYDKELNVVEDATYLGNVEASVTLTAAYLDALKKSGVYDNTAIVILADHGYVHPYTEDTILERMHCPLLIKGRAETHDEMQVSRAPISYADFASSFPRLIEGKPASEVFDYKDGDERSRRFIWYCYSKEQHMEEYIATGFADEVDKMQPTGKQYDQ